MNSKYNFFLNLISMLSGICGVMQEDTVAAYWFSLEDLSEEELRIGFKHVMATCKYNRPKPAEIRSAARPSNAMLAWMVFSKHVRGYLNHSLDFTDPIIMAVVRSKGGLRQANRTADGDFWTFYRKDFIEAYQAIELLVAKSTIDSGPLMVAGYHEGEEAKPIRVIECSYQHSQGHLSFSSKPSNIEYAGSVQPK